MSHEAGDGEVGDRERAGAGGPQLPAQRDGGESRSGLSERDLSVLAVERRGWSGPGMKERAIREQLEMSPTRYYQLLNALLDDPRALAHDPVTVNRLRRRREAQRARR
ncbi:DUF3263 domain-containing protein [Streptomyces sp. WMMB 322]|uniref:DUF3263 domain-containing protein n=1 Tax=Streptomyces sp. WMMB 322 TaxID=1286821 RepID=UPI000823F13E|nr:DUF3263 domain-containing protein [Streptomyces sp. WMMB 322]SCK06685.1 Protein of unknown function [Streptomyces sp. WMMB 322]